MARGEQEGGGDGSPSSAHPLLPSSALRTKPKDKPNTSFRHIHFQTHEPVVSPHFSLLWFLKALTRQPFLGVVSANTVLSGEKICSFSLWESGASFEGDLWCARVLKPWVMIAESFTPLVLCAHEEVLLTVNNGWRNRAKVKSYL